MKRKKALEGTAPERVSEDARNSREKVIRGKQTLGRIEGNLVRAAKEPEAAIEKILANEEEKSNLYLSDPGPVRG